MTVKRGDRMLIRSAAFALLVLPWDVGAQVGPGSIEVWAPQEPMALSVAMAKIRSPFHSAAWSSGGLDTALSPVPLLSASAPNLDSWRHQEASEDTVSAGWVFLASSIGEPLGFVGVAYCCAYDDSWLLIYSIPVTTVGVAAWMAGADPQRAAIGSILGGALGIPLAIKADNLVVGIGGLLLHTGVTAIASKIHFRTRPRP